MEEKFKKSQWRDVELTVKKQRRWLYDKAKTLAMARGMAFTKETNDKGNSVYVVVRKDDTATPIFTTTDTTPLQLYHLWEFLTDY
jgi:hypothetical protein